VSLCYATQAGRVLEALSAIFKRVWCCRKGGFSVEDTGIARPASAGNGTITSDAHRFQRALSLEGGKAWASISEGKPLLGAAQPSDVFLFSVAPWNLDPRSAIWSPYVSPGQGPADTACRVGMVGVLPLFKASWPTAYWRYFEGVQSGVIRP